eukprot:CAMPEP_0172074942 /NCGR_PEP_ID=MMETSP1043-20130122/15685_1 /TAXON_ID=464988 /ORGANISM="Hemiselmis andersenii, Strain CCMP441" /LENGTH=44 /DNA_ID= /DNA_START= /DNA_END= /DNA_ORIENTATION=
MDAGGYGNLTAGGYNVELWVGCVLITPAESQIQEESGQLGEPPP